MQCGLPKLLQRQGKSDILYVHISKSYSLFSSILLLLNYKSIMAVASHSRFEILMGYAAAIASMASSVLSAAAVQTLQGAVHDFELSAARGLLQGPLYIVIGTLLGVDLRIKREHIPPLIYLSLLYVIYNVGYYGSTVYLPLAEAIGIVSIFSMIAAVFQSKVLFKKDVTVFHILSLIVCVIGILMVVQPCFLFHKDISLPETVSPSNQVWRDIDSNQSLYVRLSSKEQCTVGVKHTIGYILCVTGGVVFGMTYDVNAILLHDLRPFVKITYFTTLYFIASIVIAFYVEPIVISLSLYQFLLVLAHSAGAAMACFFNIYSAHMIGGVRASLVFSSQILMNLFVQYTFMKSIMPGNGNWAEIVGAFVLVLGVGISPVYDILQSVNQANVLP